jgi:hypothetical protein
LGADVALARCHEPYVSSSDPETFMKIGPKRWKRARVRRAAFSAMLIPLAAGLLACGDAEEPAVSRKQALIGQCTRDVPALRALSQECTIDANCPCGSHCDPVEHACTFTCMVPPANAAESCATGSQCNDRGRCVSTSPIALTAAPTLAARPASLTTVAGGPARSLQVELSMFASGSALIAAQATPVRAVGEDGAEVSCNSGASFAHECTLTSWTFAFDGAKYNAAKPLTVRTIAGTALGRGQVHLRIDGSDTDTVVPVAAAPPTPTSVGDYRGTASGAGIPSGLPITAKQRGTFLVVRDPTRTLAPDGALVVNVASPSNPAATPWRISWLRPLGDTTGGAIMADYLPISLQYAADTGALSGTLQIRVLGATSAWSLRLTRSEDIAECQTTADCTNGDVCPNELRTCVPPSAWGGGSPIDNQFNDPRSAQWFDAMDDAIGVGDVATAASSPMFATTGADMIESLMCASGSGAGRLGVQQVHLGTAPSCSGELACVNDDGSPSLSPGAIGLTTYFDREGEAASAGLLDLCRQDLARPVSSSVATNFASTTGTCVNLARALPALRLLGSGELSKRTSIQNPFKPEYRLQDLFRRLVQQWSHLHGFLASTGLAQRQFEDATAATPEAARQGLLSLLDVLDAGWAALLDQRVAPALAGMSSSENGADADLFLPQFDYRLAKKPVAYWTFNAGASANLDLIRNAPLSPQPDPRRICRFIPCIPPPNCVISNQRNSFSQTYNCPGLVSSLPATAPSLATGGNLSVVFNIDPLDVELPPYSGGTILATATLAVTETWSNGVPRLNIIHPTGAGTMEWVWFEVGALGQFSGATNPAHGTSVAVVRDSLRQEYTVYTWNQTSSCNSRGSCTLQPIIKAFTKPYQQPVSGALNGVTANQIFIGAGPYSSGADWWTTGVPQPRASYGAEIDDVGVFDSMLSKREFLRFATNRAWLENHRDLWPSDLVLADYPTQDLINPVGTDILDAQIAHLELADRLAVQARIQAQAACDSQDLAARADVAAIVARLGRTLRQSAAVQALVRNADSDSANKDRGLLAAKTSQLLRDLRVLVECRNPYGMGDQEVPLYFGSIAPNVNEKAAFFAASEHLLTLAEQRAQTARTALEAVRLRWDQARQSQLQQLQDDTTRAIRVNELKTKYGEALIRLCGISDRSPAQILQQVIDGTFALDTCFIKPPAAAPAPACPTASTSGPVMDADPACYRGALGGALMDIRSAYYAQQAAYQSWQAAIGNAEAASRLCVLKEMDAFGCSALDRHALSGVTCPPGHQGTIELTQKFNHEMIEMEDEKMWFGRVVHTVATVVAFAVAAYTTGPGAAFVGAAMASFNPLVDEIGTAMADRERAHKATLEARALIDNINTCWSAAEQYQRAIAAAEQASKEAASRMQTAAIAFQNGVAEGREILAVAPAEIDRELHRLSIPIAFHYWLPEALETFQIAHESARRYAYLALRATEYDMLESYATPQLGKPSRGAVLGAWLPQTLINQLALMRDLTNAQIVSGPPALGHLTFDLGARFFGLSESSPEFGATLEQYAQPVYSARGEYLGRGVRFSLVPQRQDESPTWRCAERIWRVNLGATGFPATANGTHVKLLKRNVFASRRCDAEGFQVASLRPGANLLVAAGEASSYVEQKTSSVADVSLVDFNQPDALFNFKTRDDFLNGSSSELSLQELYGDYVLLFPASALASGLALSELRDFFLRFDFLSIDNTPPVQLVLPGHPSNQSPGPITVPAESVK